MSGSLKDWVEATPDAKGPSMSYPVGARVRPVTLSKTFADARKCDAEAIQAMRGKGSER